MTAAKIDAVLRQKFHAHRYRLSNAYVYAWESDFFSLTTTGYAQEIEVKVSLSDFRADFKKVDKHKAIRARFKGQKYFLKKHGKRIIVTYEEKKTKEVDGRRYDVYT